MKHWAYSVAYAALHVGIIAALAWLLNAEFDTLAIGYLIGWIIAADAKRASREARNDAP